MFNRKSKFKKYDKDEEFEPWRDNYKVAKENEGTLLDQFKEEEKLGRVAFLKEAEAKARYGDKLKIAAIIALEKDDGTFRIINDQTNGVQSIKTNLPHNFDEASCWPQ